jgi:hypothetical protein
MRKELSSMQYGKNYFVVLMISILSLSFFFPGAPVSGGQGQGKLRVVAIQGRAKVEGQDAIVEILVAVQPGENAKAKAREKLRRMFPDAEEIDSSSYSETGLNWKVDPDFQNTSQVPFVYNNGNVPTEVSGDGSMVMQAASQTWNDVATSIFQFESDSTSYNGCPSLVKECKGRQFFNGVNEIAWLDIRESSVLGVVWSGTSSIGPEFDMALDNVNFDWYVGAAPNDINLNQQIDLQTVWLHEFGHGLGLGHSNVSDSVMEAIYDGPRRVLQSDDIAGITSIYPTSNVVLPPTVSIASPTDGATFTSGATISFAGTANDNEDGNLTDSLSWNSDVDGALGSFGGSFSAVLSDGAHNITATVADSSGGTGSESVGITVIVPGEGDLNDIYVWAIDFTEKRKGRKLDLVTTVTIRRDSDANGSAEDADALVGGANVQMTLARDGNSFDFSGTTNSEGIAKFTLQHALLDTPYTATINSVSHSTYSYNNLLNVETQDTHSIQP